MRAFLLFFAMLLAGCVYVSHPVIYYHHKESDAVMKSYVSGEKMILDQPTLKPYYVNGVLVTAMLSYVGHEGHTSEGGSLYSLIFTAKSYSEDAKIELKRIGVPGLPGTPLPSSEIVTLTLAEAKRSEPFLEKQRNNGLWIAHRTITKSIKEAGLKAVIAQNKKVKVVALVAVTNNGQIEEREITYVFEGRSFGHIQTID